MSTSSTYVNGAAVAFDFAIFSVILLRGPGIGIRPSRPAGAGALFDGSSSTATAGRGAIAGVGPFPAPRTSSSVTRPPGPVPRTRSRFTPSSRASLRTAGAVRAGPPEDGADGAGAAERGCAILGAGGAGGAAGRAAA